MISTQIIPVMPDPTAVEAALWQDVQPLQQHEDPLAGTKAILPYLAKAAATRQKTAKVSSIKDLPEIKNAIPKDMEHIMGIQAEAQKTHRDAVGETDPVNAYEYQRKTDALMNEAKIQAGYANMNMADSNEYLKTINTPSEADKIDPEATAKVVEGFNAQDTPAKRYAFLQANGGKLSVPKDDTPSPVDLTEKLNKAYLQSKEVVVEDPTTGKTTTVTNVGYGNPNKAAVLALSDNKERFDLWAKKFVSGLSPDKREELQKNSTEANGGTGDIYSQAIKENLIPPDYEKKNALRYENKPKEKSDINISVGNSSGIKGGYDVTPQPETIRHVYPKGDAPDVVENGVTKRGPWKQTVDEKGQPEFYKASVDGQSWRFKPQKLQLTTIPQVYNPATGKWEDNSSTDDVSFSDAIDVKFSGKNQDRIADPGRDSEEIKKTYTTLKVVPIKIRVVDEDGKNPKYELRYVRYDDGPNQILENSGITLKGESKQPAAADIYVDEKGNKVKDLDKLTPVQIKQLVDGGVIKLQK